MKKMTTLFVIDRVNGNVAINKIMPGNEWVFSGEGIATHKIDGTSCMIQNNKLYKRFDAKPNRKIPEGFIPCMDKPDEHTNHFPGWIPVGEGNEDKFHREAFAKQKNWEDGTYELVGPKINGNKENLNQHELWKHGNIILNNIPRDFEGLKIWLENNFIEGIVFHRPNGDMCKIRRKDFGFKW